MDSDRNFCMAQDAFSKCHPFTAFLFFVGAIGFTVVIQHPLYLLVSCLGGGLYYLLLKGKKGWGMIAGMIPLFLVLTVVNPLFNTYGEHVLFLVFGRRPYTLEALCYGMAIAGIFVAMMLWFGCYNEVMTSDKFVCLFGSLIPALSLLLVLVLRLIPDLLRKARQLFQVRKSIGKGAGEASGTREKAADGIQILSALTDWALEGGIITADSMRARGYGSTRRTSFQIYRMTGRDWMLLAVILLLALCVLLGDGKTAVYTPQFLIESPTWSLAAYGLYLLIPSVLRIQDSLKWKLAVSKSYGG